jgi:hypothetical protein
MMRPMSSPPAAMPPFFWPLTEGEQPPGRPWSGVEILGHDGGTFLVVSADGSVVSIEPGADGAERFVNSSRHQFTDSLAILRDAWRVRAELSESDADEQASRLRAEVSALDAAAVEHADHWWSLIFEQLEQGLL